VTIAHGLIILALALFFRRASKVKNHPAPAEETAPLQHPVVARWLAEHEADRALDEQISGLYGIQGTDTDQVRLSDILTIIEVVVISDIVRGHRIGAYTRWEEPFEPPPPPSIEMTEGADDLVATVDVGTDDWGRVRWFLDCGTLRVNVVVGEVVDISPIPLNAPREFTVETSRELGAQVDATRATVSLSGGILTVRLPRA